MYDALTVRCTFCCADIDVPCTTASGKPRRAHRQRIVRVAMWPQDDAILAGRTMVTERREYCPTCGWVAVDHETDRVAVLVCGRILPVR
jgi:hypothetical protein